jgi:hypothetical protein
MSRDEGRGKANTGVMDEEVEEDEEEKGRRKERERKRRTTRDFIVDFK